MKRCLTLLLLASGLLVADKTILSAGETGAFQFRLSLGGERCGQLERHRTHDGPDQMRSAAFATNGIVRRTERVLRPSTGKAARPSSNPFAWTSRRAPNETADPVRAWAVSMHRVLSESVHAIEVPPACDALEYIMEAGTI